MPRDRLRPGVNASHGSQRPGGISKGSGGIPDPSHHELNHGNYYRRSRYDNIRLDCIGNDVPGEWFRRFQRNDHAD